MATCKQFIYFESQEGGMEHFAFEHSDELSCLSGWMHKCCEDCDMALVSWTVTAEIGDYFDHRLGTCVRVKDV